MIIGFCIVLCGVPADICLSPFFRSRPESRPIPRYSILVWGLVSGSLSAMHRHASAFPRSLRCGVRVPVWSAMLHASAMPVHCGSRCRWEWLCRRLFSATPLHVSTLKTRQCCSCPIMESCRRCEKVLLLWQPALPGTPSARD